MRVLTSPFRMLDARKAAILRAIVRAYVKTGQPIGSKVLAQKHRLKVSPATIRNDMSVLEELGYIVQPHTSAGRIPTDLGYRWYIDNWPGPTWPDLAESEKHAIDVAFRGDFGGLDEALDSTSQILSNVTSATAVVVAPPSIKNRLRRLELLRRDDRRATLLLIADTGVVRQGIVEFSTPRTEDDMNVLATELNKRLESNAFEELPAKVNRISNISESDRALMSEAIGKLLAHEAEEKVYRGGTANILAPNKFDDMATAQEIIGALERPPILSDLFEAARQAGTMLVFIGKEVPIQQMRACAVIFAPYEAGGDRRGALGVVGPTRMDYPHTISAVEAIARALSQLLEEG